MILSHHYDYTPFPFLDSYMRKTDLINSPGYAMPLVEKPDVVSFSLCLIQFFLSFLSSVEAKSPSIYRKRWLPYMPNIARISSVSHGKRSPIVGS
jgi:hypothetical protein